ncbi:hypothetical protein WJ542_05520 [Paraburkholderia sp. B3]|uniref:hypothetical protein n=1 Tax=Paraburkholderia sp. B3 TaxID=3134791 RepID=UPI0039819F28
MTKEMLLPIPVSVARRKSIEHHMAYHMLVTGQGNLSIIGQLFSAIYCAYFVDDVTQGRSDPDMFRLAETALHECAVRGKAEGRFEGSSEGMIAIQRVLSLRDQQFLSAPAYIIADAQTRLARFLASDDISPFAPERRSPVR